MKTCPHCGFELLHELNDGLTQCNHCSQVFDSSDLNRLLSAGWLVRKNNFSIEQIKWHCKLDDDLCILVYTFVNDYSYSNQDFYAFLKKIGVAHKSYIKFE